jgi:hypothetical protein
VDIAHIRIGGGNGRDLRANSDCFQPHAGFTEFDIGRRIDTAQTPFNRIEVDTRWIPLSPV